MVGDGVAVAVGTAGGVAAGRAVGGTVGDAVGDSVGDAVGGDGGAEAIDKEVDGDVGDVVGNEARGTAGGKAGVPVAGGTASDVVESASHRTARPAAATAAHGTVPSWPTAAPGALTNRVTGAYVHTDGPRQSHVCASTHGPSVHRSGAQTPSTGRTHTDGSVATAHAQRVALKR